MLMMLAVSTRVLFLSPSQNPNPYFQPMDFQSMDCPLCHITLTTSKAELTFLPKTFPLPVFPVLQIKIPICPKVLQLWLLDSHGY